MHTSVDRRAGLAAAAVFIATVVVANWLTSNYGLIPVGFGLVTTAGTYAAGVAFIARDTTQDGLGKVATLAVIAAAAGLSYVVADPFIATASVCAFALSELADFAVYTPLRRRGYVRAAVASNVVGALVDTLVFLHVAGFPVVRDAVAGQMVAKLTVTVLAVLVVLSVRGTRRVAPVA